MAKNPLAFLEGADELNAALRSVGDRAGGLLLKRAAEAGAAVITEEAQRLAPRDSGTLAEGITAQPGRIQQGRAQIDISFDKSDWYGMFVELGTENAPAHPFLRPALDAKAEEATDAVGQTLRDGLRDVL